MAEVKCETCRDMQEEHARSKAMSAIFADNKRDSTWVIRIGDGFVGHEYKFDDARGDVSIHQVAMIISLFLDAGSYDSKRVETEP